MHGTRCRVPHSQMDTANIVVPPQITLARGSPHVQKCARGLEVLLTAAPKTLASSLCRNVGSAFDDAWMGDGLRMA